MRFFQMIEPRAEATKAAIGAAPNTLAVPIGENSF